MNHLTPTRVLKPLISYFLAKSFKNHLTPTRVLKLDNYSKHIQTIQNHLTPTRVLKHIYFRHVANEAIKEPPHTHTGIETFPV